MNLEGPGNLHQTSKQHTNSISSQSVTNQKSRMGCSACGTIPVHPSSPRKSRIPSSTSRQNIQGPLILKQRSWSIDASDRASSRCQLGFVGSPGTIQSTLASKFQRSLVCWRDLAVGGSVTGRTNSFAIFSRFLRWFDPMTRRMPRGYGSTDSRIFKAVTDLMATCITTSARSSLRIMTSLTSDLGASVKVGPYTVFCRTYMGTMSNVSYPETCSFELRISVHVPEEVEQITRTLVTSMDPWFHLGNLKSTGTKKSSCSMSIREHFPLPSSDMRCVNHWIMIPI